MARIKYYIITILVALIILPVSVYASGSVTASSTNVTIVKGNTARVTITANNAAGRITFSNSNGNVASINMSDVFLDMGSTELVIKGLNIGTTNITVHNDDVTTYDDENISGRNITIKVTVKEPNQTAPTPPAKAKSSNNAIKNLGVEGFNLNKIDNNNYTLEVKNNITKIKLVGEAEDPTATINGIGEKEVNIGENVYEIVVTAESGTQNKIYIKVYRKDSYYLEDINEAYKENDNKDVSLTIKEDSKVSNSDLELVKSKGGKLSLNFYDNNKFLLYSWQIDGTQIKESKEFSTLLTFTSDNQKEISYVSNYADGLYLNFDHNGDLPKGTSIKVYVGNKFDNGSKVNVFHYDEKNKKLDAIEKSPIVIDGYVTFDIEHCSEYFVTMSSITSTTTKKSDKKINKTYVIISLLEVVLIILILAVDYLNVNPISKIRKNSN